MLFNREIRIVKVQSGAVLVLYAMVGDFGIQKNHKLYTSSGQKTWTFGQFVNYNYAVYSVTVGEWESESPGKMRF